MLPYNQIMERIFMKMVCLGGTLLTLFIVFVQYSSSSAPEIGSTDYGVEMMPEKPYVDAIFKHGKADERLNPISDAEKACFDDRMDREERDSVRFSSDSDAMKRTLFCDKMGDVSFSIRPELDKAFGMVSVGSNNDESSDQSRSCHGSKDERTSMDLTKRIEQMEILILKQTDQVQKLESVIEKLKQVTERLENELLFSVDPEKSDYRNSENRFRFRISPMEKETHPQRCVSACTNSEVQQMPDCNTNTNDQQIAKKRKDKDGHVIAMEINTDANGEEAGIKSHEKDVDNEEMTKEIVESASSLVDIGIKPSKNSPHGGITIARYKPAWSEHFQFLSAVKVDGDVTCLHVLPHEGEEGLSKYVAVGVNTGRVYIFSLHGDLLVDFLTKSAHPITAMLSFLLRRNETMFLTGHADGSVFIHKLLETELHRVHSHGDDWHGLCIEHMKTLTSSGENHMIPGSMSSYDKGERKDDVVNTSKVELVDKLITILEVYRIGKMRYILAADAGGNIRVFRENGTFYGTARASSRPLTFLRSPNSQRLLFLTENGVASVDLRSLSIQAGPCEGLNASRVISYAFDASGRPKAHGFTVDGDMIYVALSGDTLRFQCNVKSKRKCEVGGHAFPRAIKGYLLVATKTELLVYNTTLHDLPRLLFAAPIHEISLSFLSTKIPSGNNHPLMACNRERLVVLGFGGGYVSMYKSNLPLHKHVEASTKFWNSPLFMIMAILVGGWHYFSKKKDGPTPLQETSESHLSPSSDIMQSYTMRSVSDESKEARVNSRRFNSFPNGSMKYRNSVADLSFRTSPSSSLEALRSTTSILDNVGENSSLEPHSYLKREDVNARFRAATVGIWRTRSQTSIPS